MPGGVRIDIETLQQGRRQYRVCRPRINHRIDCFEALTRRVTHLNLHRECAHTFLTSQPIGSIQRNTAHQMKKTVIICISSYFVMPLQGPCIV